MLEGKFAGPTVFTGRLVKLGAKVAELHSDAPVAALSSLKMTPQRPSGEPVAGDLFAKVLGDTPTEVGTRVVMRFTSVPQDIRLCLDAAELRYEYHTISRSMQR